MVSRCLRQLQLLTLAAGLTACAASGTTRPSADDQGSAIHPDALVPLGPGEWVTARATATGVAVNRVSARPGTLGVLASGRSQAGSNSVHLVSYAGATGSEWNTFVFGTAEAVVTRVVLDGLGGRGGRVHDGAWVIALRARDVRPDALTWRFLTRDGAVIVAGRGLLPGVLPGGG